MVLEFMKRESAFVSPEVVQVWLTCVIDQSLVLTKSEALKYSMLQSTVSWAIFNWTNNLKNQ